MQAKHSDDDGEDDGDDGEDGDDEDVNVLFLKKKRPAIILYLLKVRLLSLASVTFHKKPIAGTYICLIICAGWSLGRFARTSRRKFATRSRGRSARPSTTSSVSLCLTWFANRFRSNILSMLLMLSQVVCKQGQTQHIVNVAIVVKGANDRVHLGGSESL